MKLSISHQFLTVRKCFSFNTPKFLQLKSWKVRSTSNNCNQPNCILIKMLYLQLHWFCCSPFSAAQWLNFGEAKSSRTPMDSPAAKLQLNSAWNGLTTGTICVTGNVPTAVPLGMSALLSSCSATIASAAYVGTSGNGPHLSIHQLLPKSNIPPTIAHFIYMDN